MHEDEWSGSWVHAAHMLGSGICFSTNTSELYALMTELNAMYCMY